MRKTLNLGLAKKARTPTRLEKSRARLRKSALAAWAELQATGLHVAGQEADAWLSCLADGSKSKTPKPHR